MRDARQSTSILLIAHRLATVRTADCIVVMDAGRVVESGTHAELLARPAGAYRALLVRQSGGGGAEAEALEADG